MPDLFENPLGLDGFEFVEFCAPEKGLLEPVFESLGFTRIARHRSKDVDLWRQGEINLIANYEPRSRLPPILRPNMALRPAAWPSGCAMQGSSL
jgi:4-hydroxyphenylpyruvate dioxygenase-like putative hemolysin